MTTNSDEPKKRHGNKQLDDDSAAMLYQGISLSQATTIFAMDLRDIKAKIQGHVTPCGERRQNPIYQIRDLAPYLVRPAYPIEEYIQRMSKADLPTALSKEFWAGQRSKQLYEMAAAELWPTNKVVETVSTLLKTIRMSILLTREAVERETELTPRQREIIIRLIDSALEEAHDKTVSQFTEAEPNAGSASADPDESDDQEDL